MSHEIKAWNNGFLEALALFGVGDAASVEALPDISQLVFVNCAYYTGDFEEGMNYLNAESYVTIFSSKFSYIPQKGGVVMMGAYQLIDWGDYSGVVPRALLRITADDKVIFEGEVSTYFSRTVEKNVKPFSYKRSFRIEAKRLNLSDGMTLELYKTLIIGYK